jgi:non-heme chloroperoxidase
MPSQILSRRNMLAIGAGVPLITALPSAESNPLTKPARRKSASTITIKDRTEIYYKDWGSGAPVLFSHGWPLTADSWESQMLFLAQHGYRVIAHDRRGHGRSSQPWHGNEMNTYADDLAALIETLDIKHATLVGFSTGGGEVARYIGRHGTRRLSKAVLVSAVPPLMLKTAANPGGESPRILWRLNTLRGLSHEEVEQVLTRGA